MDRTQTDTRVIHPHSQEHLDNFPIGAYVAIAWPRQSMDFCVPPIGLKTEMGHNIDDGSLGWKCGMVVNKQQVWGQLVLAVTYCLPNFLARPGVSCCRRRCPLRRFDFNRPF